MTTHTHEEILPGSAGRPMLVRAYQSDNSHGAMPVIIFVHGFKGFMDWGPSHWCAGSWQGKVLP